MSLDMETHNPEEMSQEEMHSEEMPLPQTQKTCKDLSVTALVLGMVGFLIAWHPFISIFGVVVAILSIVFGTITMGDIKAGRLLNVRGAMAMIGVHLGIVTIGIAIAFFIYRVTA